MAEVLVTNFEELDVPAFTEYKCVTYNNNIYIVNNGDGIYKYDTINKVFSHIYNSNVGVKCDIYQNIIYIAFNSAIDDSNHPYITFKRFNLDTESFVTDITLTSTTKLSVPSGYARRCYAGRISIVEDNLFVFFKFGYGRVNGDWTSSSFGGICYNLSTNTYNYNVNITYCYPLKTICNDRFFSAYDFDFNGRNIKQYNITSALTTAAPQKPDNINYDFSLSCGFERKGLYYLFGGQTSLSENYVYNPKSKNFTQLQITLPQETNKKSVGYYSDNGDKYVIFYPNGIFTLSFINYNLTYNIKDQKGESTYKELLNNAPINSVRFNYQIGGENVGYNITTLSDSVVGTYKTQIPNGYKLAGFSDVPYSTSVKFPLNTDIALSVDTNFTFYEVYQKDNPVTPTLTFKHFYDAGTIGSGTVKFRHYSQRAQLATPQNVAASGTIVSWGAVENATSYEILVNNSSFGAVSTTSVDLSTLSGWASLTDGEYSVTIVAKADGYTDSEPSAGVSVTKAFEPPTDCITFTGETSDFTLKATKKVWDGTVEYCTDVTPWTVWDGTAISSHNKKLYLRGSGNTKFYTSDGARFVLSAKAGCSGNLNTLLEYSNPPTTLNASYCYAYMFIRCANLTAAPALPATTLADYCYQSMFYGCTNLTTAPELPATTLASECYRSMFDGCKNLTQAPALPATTLADRCYESMFYGCTNLTTAPELPATTLAYNCYNNMFRKCTAFKVSSTKTGTYQYAWRIPTSGTISSTQSGWNAYMLRDTGGTFTSDPSINTTYYVENEPV